jgi:hypothetical protein
MRKRIGEHWLNLACFAVRLRPRSSSPKSPWIVVRADDKRAGRLNIIRDLISRLECPETDTHLATPDPSIVFPYDAKRANHQQLAR